MAILKAEGGQIGLVRMVQVTSSSCVVEATIDNIPIGEYSINIHQLGDISRGGDRYRFGETIPMIVYACNKANLHILDPL